MELSHVSDLGCKDISYLDFFPWTQIPLGINDDIFTTPFPSVCSQIGLGRVHLMHAQLLRWLLRGWVQELPLTRAVPDSWRGGTGLAGLCTGCEEPMLPSQRDADLL